MQAQSSLTLPVGLEHHEGSMREACHPARVADMCLGAQAHAKCSAEAELTTC